jgi:hypothetical protein
MQSRTVVPPLFIRVGSWTLLALLFCVHCGLVYAGFQGFRTSSVGGVSINVEGVVGPPSIDGRKKHLEELRKEIKMPAGELIAPVEMRMVSLRGLEAACQDALKNNFGKLPDEVRFLAGLQRIRYVFVYPEDSDIVLAGPGEGWKVDEMANVVGVTTGRPVLQLDDLLTALRSVEEARRGAISVSIDPTEEGTRRLNRLLSQHPPRGTISPALEAAMKKEFGPQQITITGVPATTHFARIMVAADYRMKRIAMNIDRSPVKGLPSYVEMIRNHSTSAINNSTPRWWLACNYQPLAATEDGLAWELRGPGVKAMTEDEMVTAEGKRVELGKASPTAQKWSDLMTAKYDELSGQDAVFGELRNLMDMCVVAALMQKEHLWEKAGLSVPLLTDSSSELKTEVWHSPRTVTPEISFLKAKNGLIVTASGGVSVESWQVADRKETVAAIGELRKKASSGGQKTLWWQ